jgi:hypothetical protein
MTPILPTALVVTSIHPPTEAMRELAAGCREHGWDFVVAGDAKSPTDFALEGCRLLSLAGQLDSGFALAKCCPERSYTRKNLGYLAAIQAGAKVVVETDDDNHPRSGFWRRRELAVGCRQVAGDGWVNVYQYFSRRFIYPRGLPLRHARDQGPAAGGVAARECPVQQGLADHDPDVDAVYRMLFPLPFEFEADEGPVLLTDGAWCPFNSQNTTFFEAAFPLLYLPARCSFRMTDIWRSFVAQRVLQALGWGILYHGATVWQERNDHDLQRDFVEEMPGYEHNEGIRQALTGLDLKPGDSVRVMVERCYETLIRRGWVGAGEEQLLRAWLDDLRGLGVGL